MSDEHIWCFCMHSVVCLWEFVYAVMGAGKSTRHEKLGQTLRWVSKTFCGETMAEKI